MTRYIYYVKFSVWFGKELLSNGAYEYVLEKKIDSWEDLENIINDIRDEDEIGEDDVVLIDFYSFLREETVNES